MYDPTPDADLRAYAQSKLGLMQVSTLLRHGLGHEQGQGLAWLEVANAHPGLVWTPMLQRHWGGLVPVLEKSGAAGLLFKTPESAATTVLTAALAPRSRPPPGWGENPGKWQRGVGGQQVPYFVNTRPRGYASEESRDVQAAREMWKRVLECPVRAAIPDWHGDFFAS